MSGRRRSNRRHQDTNCTAGKDVVTRNAPERKATEKTARERLWTLGWSLAIILVSTVVAAWSLRDPANVPNATVI